MAELMDYQPSSTTKNDQTPTLGQTNQDQDQVLQSGTAKDTQVLEDMDIDSDNQALPPDPSVTQPSGTGTQGLAQTPVSDLGDQSAEQISSSMLGNPSTVTDRQQQDIPKTMRTSPVLDLYTDKDTSQDLYRSLGETQSPPAAAADVTETSTTASSDATHKKRPLNIPGGTLKEGGDDGEQKPSAPRDVAKLYVKVDWSGDLPPKWKILLEKALQTWGNSDKAKEKCSIEVVRLLEDEHFAEVEITPSTALKDIKSATLTFKDLNKIATVDFLDDAPKVNMTVTTEKETIQPDHMKGAGASSNVPEASEIPGASTALKVPPFGYWYLSQVYKKELERIENEFGVKINAETHVSISDEKTTEKRESDSVRRAAQAFADLYQVTGNNLKPVSVPHTHMESEIMKQVLRNIPNEENKIMLNMSANNYLLFGPEYITSMVSKQLNLEPGVEIERSFVHSEAHSAQWGTSASRTSVQTSQTLKMDIKDTRDQIEMDEPHWNLMNVAFEKQLREIQSKHAVQFRPEPDQGVIKVSARSTGTHQVNLEAHALRALTHLYQKVVTSAIICDLKDASDAEIVSQTFKGIRSQHSCIGGGERNGSWNLFGLPKHLVPAIADIEKMLGKPVFDDKTRQLLGHPWGFPQRRRFQTEQMEMDMMRGAHGTDPRGGTENNDFNQEFLNKAKENDKEKSSEDKCSICLDMFTQKTKLDCGHEFCRECLTRSIQSSGEICPLCKKIFGILKGNQPDGMMSVQHHKYELPGFPRCGTIQITYNIKDGIQTSHHPNPGKRFHGTARTAYLPDNAEGKHVLGLLMRAFDRKLIFTVGFSRTTGADDVVIWNDIHHKTSTHGGPQNYGYPDSDYLKRVKEELKAKGIE